MHHPPKNKGHDMSKNFSDYWEQEISDSIRNNSDMLYLAGNLKGETLPTSILEIPGLRHLSLFEINIDMPEWLCDLSNLESLEIEEAQSFKKVLPHLWKLKNLKKLKLAYADLDEIPSSLNELMHLEELNVDGADFEDFPSVSVNSFLDIGLHFKRPFAEA